MNTTLPFAVFFGLGGPEIAVILIIGIVIFGPAQLPRMARGLGESLKILRRDAKELRDVLPEVEDDVREIIERPRKDEDEVQGKRTEAPSKASDRPKPSSSYTDELSRSLGKDAFR